MRLPTTSGLTSLKKLDFNEYPSVYLSLFVRRHARVLRLPFQQCGGAWDFPFVERGTNVMIFWNDNLTYYFLDMVNEEIDSAHDDPEVWQVPDETSCFKMECRSESEKVSGSRNWGPVASLKQAECRPGSSNLNTRFTFIVWPEKVLEYKTRHIQSL